MDGGGHKYSRRFQVRSDQGSRAHDFVRHVHPLFGAGFPRLSALGPTQQRRFCCNSPGSLAIFTAIRRARKFDSNQRARNLADRILPQWNSDTYGTPICPNCARPMPCTRIIPGFNGLPELRVYCCLRRSGHPGRRTAQGARSSLALLFTAIRRASSLAAQLGC